jgi:hypothetical protein
MNENNNESIVDIYMYQVECQFFFFSDVEVKLNEMA